MRTTILSLLLLSAAALQAADAITFTEHIAPLVYANCASCHRPGEAAPFSLLTFDDVKKRATLIAAVTKARYMPPWHAEHDYGQFADERRLSDAQIAMIAEWVKQGMPEGDRAKMPAIPQFPQGWHLGKPDLIIEMPEEFEIPASGPDVFRNFSIPLNLTEDKWIRAIEFRPTARTAAHHALFANIAEGSTKRYEGTDGRPGFGGMGTVGVNPNGGNLGLGGWAVGGTPVFLPDGLAMKLPKANDFLLQMHFHPTGKVEKEKALVGFYFADRAPERKLIALGAPVLFGIGSGIDIAPGDKTFAIRDSFVLPVDVRVYGTGAHAHYLGREMRAAATLPDGSTRPLLHISDWDFNWQEQYNYKDSFVLPKGTRIDASITYDNSAGNPRNPSNPPKRAQFGEESSDEMGAIFFNVTVLRNEDEAPLLQSISTRAQAEIRRGGADGTVGRFLRSQQSRGAVNIPRPQQITMVDRAGKTIQTVGPAATFNGQSVPVSPDGTRVAVVRTEPPLNVQDIWVYEIATGNPTRITSDPETNGSLVWSPDSKQIAYSSNVNNRSTIFVKSADGTGNAELIYAHAPGQQLILTDWTGDELVAWAGKATYVLPLKAERKLVTLFDETYNVRAARLSPDGKWIAYSSDQTGGWKLYVAKRTATGVEKPTASLVPETAMGSLFWPTGAREGKELYYIVTQEGQFMNSVPLKMDGDRVTAAGAPSTLFKLPGAILALGQLSNIASGDGETFAYILGAQ